MITLLALSALCLLTGIVIGQALPRHTKTEADLWRMASEQWESTYRSARELAELYKQREGDRK